jgi:preprotein translocase subunit SecY
MHPVVDFIGKYREILQRLAVTIAMLTILRLGMFIPLPGVDMTQLQPGATATEGRALQFLTMSFCNSHAMAILVITFMICEVTRSSAG